MMRRTINTICTVGLFTAELGAQSVGITAGNRSIETVGQGVTLPHGTRDCVVVLPLHVIASQSTPITVTGDDGVSEEAGEKHFVSLPDADLALLSLPLNHPFPCVRWNAQAVAGLIDAQEQRPMLRWRQGSSVAFLPVEIMSRSTRLIAIVPASPTGQLQKTMSGAQLMLGGVTAGILLEVDSIGQGMVLRSDWVEKLLPPLLPRPSTESWTIGDRRASLGFMGDGHLLNNLWGGGIEVSLPLRRDLDVLVHGGYIYRPDVIYAGISATGHISSVEVGPRFWVTPRGRDFALYLKAAGIGTIYRAYSDLGNERTSSAAAMAGAGVSARVLPRIFLSLEYQERHHWPLISSEGADPDDEVASFRWPIMRFGLTKYW